MRALALVVGLFAFATWAVPVQPPPPDVIPANGATVGRNTKIWVFESGTGVALLDARGAPVMTTLTRIAIPPLLAFEKLTPMMELAPGRYDVHGNGQLASSFTVIDQIDTTPPERPEVQVTPSGKVGSMVSTVLVTATTANDSFIVVMGEPQQWEPASAHAAGSNGMTAVYDLRAGEHRFKIVRVDAAGNASEPLEVVTNVPKDRACSVAPVLPLSLLALMLLRRRRR